MTPGAAGYFDYFNGQGVFGGPAGDRDKGYYSFDVGTWHLVSLNANCQLPEVGCSWDSAQARWLRADLEANGERCVLAYAGRPRFSTNQFGKYQPLTSLFNILYRERVELLLSGDVHHERFAPQTPGGRASPRGVRQFVVGATAS